MDQSNRREKVMEKQEGQKRKMKNCSKRRPMKLLRNLRKTGEPMM